jgi:periplasmic protein TonB
MFDMLAQAPERGPLGGGLASAAVHAALISGAVLATLQTRPAAPLEHPQVPIIYEVPAGPESPPAPTTPIAGIAPPLLGAPVLALPTVVPTVIPPPSTVPFDPSQFAGTPAGPGAARVPRTGPPAEAVYAERWVEDPPELVSHPAVRYPELLSRAGVEGRVVIEAVIDTAGRVEPGSLRVVSSTNPLFDAPARELVGGTRYRPGRMDGRAVRVRVTVPVAFQVSRRSPMM